MERVALFGSKIRRATRCHTTRSSWESCERDGRHTVRPHKHHQVLSWLTMVARTVSGLDGHLIHTIVSCVELNEEGPFPSEPFALANDWLVKIYPVEEPTDITRKEVVQRIFLLIERIVAASPMACCSAVVLSMSDALCLWTKDAIEALSDTEYNETVSTRRT